MNKTTAYRNFGKPSYTPAKQVKIYDTKWYLVTMQNTEHDQGDGYYLAEGEYTLLLTGKQARDKREAHLNHCNKIAEYLGPVYHVSVRRYWHVEPTIEYAVSEIAAQTIIAKFLLEQTRHRHDWQKSIDHYLEATPASLCAQSHKRGIGTNFPADSPYWVEDCQRGYEYGRKSADGLATDIARGDWPNYITKITR